MNILIVEDDISSAEAIQKQIDALGHGAEIAPTGQDALKMVKGNGFDLILLDIYLPDCLGHELIPKFREMRADIGIVTITGYNSRELEQEVRQKGILFFMIKPFNLNEMKEILNHFQKKKIKPNILM